MPSVALDPPLTVACSLLRERLTGNFGCDSIPKKNIVCDEEPLLLGLDDECANLIKVSFFYKKLSFVSSYFAMSDWIIVFDTWNNSNKSVIDNSLTSIQNY